MGFLMNSKYIHIFEPKNLREIIEHKFSLSRDNGYITAIILKIDDFFLYERLFKAILSREENDRLEKLIFYSHKLKFIIVHGILRYIMGKIYESNPKY